MTFVHQILSQCKTQQRKWPMGPAKTQISWSESSLSAWGKIMSLATHKAHSEDFDQTGYTGPFVGFVICWLHCFRAKAALHWLIIKKYNVHTSSSLQVLRPIPWTMNYRSQVQVYIYFEVRRRVIQTHNPKEDVQPLKYSRYKAKSLDHEIQITVTYIYF